MPHASELPDDNPLRLAHAHSIFHRAEIEASSLCGCFNCKRIFTPQVIKEWTDTTNPQSQQTAICPLCGIDSVIGDKAGFALTPEFLREMHRAWF